MRTAVWGITTCGKRKEAIAIGRALLRQRSIACYDCVPRLASGYFWPPKTGKIELAKGVLIFMTTLPECIPAIYRTVKKIHSDAVPFLATVVLNIRPVAV